MGGRAFCWFRLSFLPTFSVNPLVVEESEVGEGHDHVVLVTGSDDLLVLHTEEKQREKERETREDNERTSNEEKTMNPGTMQGTEEEDKREHPVNLSCPTERKAKIEKRKTDVC